jgi:hypothetical protein
MLAVLLSAIEKKGGEYLVILLRMGTVNCHN